LDRKRKIGRRTRGSAGAELGRMGGRKCGRRRGEGGRKGKSSFVC